jgi:hypothetical protein
VSALMRLDRLLPALTFGQFDDPFAWADTRRQIRRSV